jgi:hypothetical protein
MLLSTSPSAMNGGAPHSPWSYSRGNNARNEGGFGRFLNHPMAAMLLKTLTNAVIRIFHHQNPASAVGTNRRIFYVIFAGDKHYFENFYIFSLPGNRDFRN